jgi:hypothetical protein
VFDVLEVEMTLLVEHQGCPTPHVVSNGASDANSTARALRLKPDRDVYNISMQVTSIRDGVADAYAYPKADGSIRRLAAIPNRYLLLNRDCTSHRAINAVEYHEKGIAAGLHDPATMCFYGRVYEISTEDPQSFQGPSIIHPDQAAVPDHVEVDDSHQLSAVRQPRHIRSPSAGHASPGQPTGANDNDSLSASLGHCSTNRRPFGQRYRGGHFTRYVGGR